tara:strand:- start:8 stop:256 length:249 start_codon:yes stop_codon:yes gene_type:complete
MTKKEEIEQLVDALELTARRTRAEEVEVGALIDRAWAARNALIERINTLEEEIAKKDEIIKDLHGVLVAKAPRGHGFSRKGR